jgi:hypothetical protein
MSSSLSALSRTTAPTQGMRVPFTARSSLFFMLGAFPHCPVPAFFRHMFSA